MFRDDINKVFSVFLFLLCHRIKLSILFEPFFPLNFYIVLLNDGSCDEVTSFFVFAIIKSDKHMWVILTSSKINNDANENEKTKKQILFKKIRFKDQWRTYMQICISGFWFRNTTLFNLCSHPYSSTWQMLKFGMLLCEKSSNIRVEYLSSSLNVLFIMSHARFSRIQTNSVTNEISTFFDFYENNL